MSDINVLYPVGVEVTVGGVTASLWPIKLRNCQVFAGLSGQLAGLMAEISPIALAKFCAQNGDKIASLLLDQTSLTDEQVSEMTSNAAVMWLYQLVWNNQSDFNQALSEQTAALGDGARSISG